MSANASGIYPRTERPAAPCCGEVGCAHDPAGVPTVPAPRPDPLDAFRAAKARLEDLDAAMVRQQREVNRLWAELDDARREAVFADVFRWDEMPEREREVIREMNRHGWD